MKITLSRAEAIVAEAKEFVLAKGLPPMSISVVDQGGHLVALCRMDGAFIGATDIAHRKARTAALFSVDSATLDENFKSVGGAHTLESTNQGLIGIGGGVVLRDSLGEVIGAVGVSGGSVAEDALVAQAAAVAISG
jgi:uncharacterized protein GlcG (DUF336 family)